MCIGSPWSCLPHLTLHLLHGFAPWRANSWTGAWSEAQGGDLSVEPLATDSERPRALPGLKAKCLKRSSKTCEMVLSTCWKTCFNSVSTIPRTSLILVQVHPSTVTWPNHRIATDSSPKNGPITSDHTWPSKMRTAQSSSKTSPWPKQPALKTQTAPDEDERTHLRWTCEGSRCPSRWSGWSHATSTFLQGTHRRLKVGHLQRAIFLGRKWWSYVKFKSKMGFQHLLFYFKNLMFLIQHPYSRAA